MVKFLLGILLLIISLPCLGQSSGYPDKTFSQLKEEIYQNEKAKSYASNLDLFQNGHQQGYFFMLDERIPRYKAYLEFKEFANLVSADKNLREAANLKSETQFKVCLPSSTSDQATFPILYILHGGGSNFERSMKNWTSPLLDSLFIRVFVQSYLHYDYQTFGWRNSDKRGLEDFIQLMAKINQAYPVDTTQVFIAGVSAGGTQAVYSALMCTPQINGYLGVCTGIPNQLSPQDFEQASIRAFMIAGENDFYKPRQDSLAKLYQQYGIEHHYRIIENMGHVYPDNFAQIVDEGLTYLTQHED